jgi:hypothetical protein
VKKEGKEIKEMTHTRKEKRRKRVQKRGNIH